MFFQGMEGKWLQVILSLSSLSSCFCFCITYVFWFHFKSVYFYTLFCLTCLCLFSVLFYFVFHIKTKKKIEKSEKYKNSVCFVYIGTCVPWMTIETKFSKLCIFCNLDEYFYVQQSKWVLWLLFVMSKIKLFCLKRKICKEK